MILNKPLEYLILIVGKLVIAYVNLDTSINKKTLYVKNVMKVAKLVEMIRTAHLARKINRLIYKINVLAHKILLKIKTINASHAMNHV